MRWHKFYRLPRAFWFIASTFGTGYCTLSSIAIPVRVWPCIEWRKRVTSETRFSPYTFCLLSPLIRRYCYCSMFLVCIHSKNRKQAYWNNICQYKTSHENLWSVFSCFFYRNQSNLETIAEPQTTVVQHLKVTWKANIPIFCSFS